jgi:hypothetical protein
MKKLMRQASVLVSGLLCFLFIFTQAAFAQGKPVTSSKLSVADVTPDMARVVAIMAKRTIGPSKPKLIKVLGVHQEGNHATVYYLTETRGYQGINTRDLVRFNSGVWYDFDTDNNMDSAIVTK